MTNPEELILTIEDVAFGGEGVARKDKKVIFIPLTLPGEKVRVKVSEEKKNFSRGKLLEVLEESPNRQKPQCPFFGPCLGCSYLHATYESQLKLKAKQIADLLQRIGKISQIPTLQTVPSNAPLGYRNKVKMHIEKNSESRKVGYIGQDNKSIVDIDQCLIASPKINQALKEFRVSQENIPSRGVWLARESKNEKVQDFFFEKGKVLHKSLPLIKDEVKEITFLSPFESFFQTNPKMIEKLVDVAESMLMLNKETTLIDAYCGVGLFSLCFAKKVKEVIGIEEDRRAIGCALKNARISFAKNAFFIPAKVEHVLGDVLSQKKGEKLTLLLDPPRTGCHAKVLKSIVQNQINDLVYVSCNPSTLARDLGFFISKEYQLTQVVLVDMFPQTAYAEVVCQIKKI